MTTIFESHFTTTVLHDEVATLTLRNAKSMNVLGTPAILELTAALQQLGAREDVRVIILRGTGEKAFMGGGDINEMSGFNSDTAREFISRLRDLGEAIRSVPQPVIARMAGWCLGGGLEMAVACDARIADSDAQIGMPEVAVGIPSVIHAALIPSLIGRSRAQRLIMTGEPIDAETALTWGLVDTVVDNASLDDEVSLLAKRYCEIGRGVLAQQKTLLNSWDNLPLQQAVDQSVDAFSRAYETGEPQRIMGEFNQRKNRAPNLDPVTS